MGVLFNINKTIELTEGENPEIDILIQAFKDGSLSTITVTDEDGNIVHSWVKT